MMHFPKATKPRTSFSAAWLSAFFSLREVDLLRSMYKLLPLRVRTLVSTLNLRSASRLSEETRFKKTSRWEVGVVAPAPRRERRAVLSGVGINVFGFFDGQFGLAESARLYTKALIENGVPVEVNNIPGNGIRPSGESAFEGLVSDTAPHPVSIVFANPDFFLGPEFSRIRSRLDGTKVIGCWFWELERIPPEWLPALDMVDGVLVASRFVEDAFLGIASKPVLRVPIPVVTQEHSGLARSDFGLEEDAFVFLTTFDFNSSLARKNPMAVVAAFKSAFPSSLGENVALLVKSSNGSLHPMQLEALWQACSEDARITLVDEIIDAVHLRALQNSCDAFVSLHRSEGFGLGLAECLLIGKHVIATGWSGSSDIMACMPEGAVDFRLIPVEKGEYPYDMDALWADPDQGDAALKMRNAYSMGKRMMDDELSPSRSRIINLFDPKAAAVEISGFAKGLLIGQSRAASQ